MTEQFDSAGFVRELETMTTSATTLLAIWSTCRCVEDACGLIDSDLYADAFVSSFDEVVPALNALAHEAKYRHRNQTEIHAHAGGTNPEMTPESTPGESPKTLCLFSHCAEPADEDGRRVHWHAEISNLAHADFDHAKRAFLTEEEARLYLLERINTAFHDVRWRMESTMVLSLRHPLRHLLPEQRVAVQLGDWVYHIYRCDSLECSGADPGHPDIRCPVCFGRRFIRTSWTEEPTCFACNGSGYAISLDWDKRATLCGWR